MTLRQIGTLFLLLSLLVMGGCASRQTADQQAQQYSDPRDPIEGFNRTMWDFNYEVLDEYILRPLAVAWRDYMPGFARKGLYNAALNLEEPSNTVNNLLQGKLDGTFTSLGRFVLNSTLGLLGTIDVASDLGLDRRGEEFGEVLGSYGVGTGAYLVLPAQGPNDLRSGVGSYVDNAYFPLADLNIYLSVLRFGVKALEARVALMSQEQTLESSLDPYAFVKDAYFQRLEFKVNDGLLDSEEEDLDEFDEFEEDEDIDALLDDL